jgi:hypothetical protein
VAQYLWAEEEEEDMEWQDHLAVVLMMVGKEYNVNFFTKRFF